MLDFTCFQTKLTLYFIKLAYFGHTTPLPNKGAFKFEAPYSLSTAIMEKTLKVIGKLPAAYLFRKPNTKGLSVPGT